MTLTRNKSLYEDFTTKDTFLHRLIIFLFHFAFFIQKFKQPSNDKELQNIYDYVFKQLEYTIREEGYGDTAINKKMKNYVNIFHSILEKIQNWNNLDYLKKKTILLDFLNLDTATDTKIVEYFDNYSKYLSKNSLNSLLKGVSNP